MFPKRYTGIAAEMGRDAIVGRTISTQLYSKVTKVSR
jgi:hypothetical protein